MDASIALKPRIGSESAVLMALTFLLAETLVCGVSLASTVVDFTELIADYKDYTLNGWHCSRCGWRFEKDNRLADIDAFALARAEFLNHNCGAGSE